MYLRYKNKLTTVIRNCEKQYFRNLFQESKKASKSIWALYNTFMKSTHNANIGQIKVDGKFIANSFDIAETFNTYFSNNFFMLPITEQELAQEINKLSSKTSSGFDKILPKLVKCTSEFITQPLTHIYIIVQYKLQLCHPN